VPNQWLLVVVLYSAYIAGRLRLDALPPVPANREPLPHFPAATLTLVAVIGLSAVLQAIFPSVLAALERDAIRVAAGEWWRLLTAVFVQDGGGAGAIFNLIGLLLIGSVAEHLWGTRRWLLIFVAGSLAGEAIALAWQPIGAGNSVANFGLAGAVCIPCVIGRPPRRVAIGAALALGGAAALFLRRDIHGAAALTGALTAFALVILDGQSRSRWTSIEH
jgi:membrane associated rhomboid family serine protease